MAPQDPPVSQPADPAGRSATSPSSATKPRRTAFWPSVPRSLPRDDAAARARIDRFLTQLAERLHLVLDRKL